MRFDPLIGGSYPAELRIADTERTINWIPEPMEVGADVRLVLVPAPGAQGVARTPFGPVRALLSDDRRLVVVAGETVYLGDASSWHLTPRFWLPGTGPASIASNGEAGQQILVASDAGVTVVYDLAGERYVRVLDGHTIRHVAVLDGYFLALEPETSRVYWSAAFDGTSWRPGLDFIARSTAFDRWQAMAVAQRQLWLFGERTTEVWQLSGTATLLEPLAGGLVNVGIAAPWSVAPLDVGLIWVGRSDRGFAAVYRSQAVQPLRVSTLPVERALRLSTRLAEAIGWSYEDGGHTFYVLEIPDLETTWVYDTLTGLWAERGGWEVASATYTRWRPRYHVVFRDRHVVGDRVLGTLSVLSREVFEEPDGRILRRLRRSPPVQQELRWIAVHQFVLDAEVGRGLSEPLAHTPRVLLRASKDGGSRWTDLGAASAGAIGETWRRLVWRRLGQGRRWVFEISLDEPVPAGLINAYLDATVTPTS